MSTITLERAYLPAPRNVCQRVFAAMKGSAKRVVVDTTILRDFLNSAPVSVSVNNSKSVALVVGLFGTWNPFAVLWRVVCVDINALKGPAIGARPHIRKEAVKVFSPFTAHANAAATIVRVIMGLFVVAAHSRVIPGAVFTSLVRRNTAKLIAPLIALVFTEAPAAFGASEVMRTNKGCVPAVALTEPSTTRLSLYDNEAPRSLSDLYGFPLLAPAATCVPGSKLLGFDSGRVPALAPADPCAMASTIGVRAAFSRVNGH